MRILSNAAFRFASLAVAVSFIGVISSQTLRADSLVIKKDKCTIPGVDENGVLKNSLGGEFDTKTPGKSPVIVCRGKVMNQLGRAYTAKVVVTVDGTTTEARLTISASGQATAVVKQP